MNTAISRTLGAALLFAAVTPAIDRIVDRNNPNAYATLQAALDAAIPGDRVILRTTDNGPLRGSTTVTKSVTIRGEGGGIASTGEPALVITTLTPGLPLILENLVIETLSTGSSPHAVVMTAAAAPIAGEIVFDGVEVRGEPGNYALHTSLDLAVDRLTVRRSVVRMGDTANNNACCEELYNDGGDALRFTGRDLFLEDTTLIAGNANRLAYSAGCFGSCPDGGRGGAALVANGQVVTLVRSALADGNGGSVDAGPFWPRQPTPGLPGVSRLVATGGLFAGYATTLQSGLPDRGGPNQTRGAINVMGLPFAPLTVGSARLGQLVTFTVTPDATSNPLALLLGFGRAAANTGLGVLHIPSSALAVIAPFAAPGQLNVAVPNNPALVDVAVVAQHAYVLRVNPADPRLGNPTATRVRL